jgi:hypothetical protein
MKQEKTNKNKLVIDLRRVNLSDKQSKDLHKAIHKAITTQLGKFDIANNKEKPAADAVKSITTKAAVATMTVNLNVTFINTIPGKSELTAILNEEEKTIDRSGVISFKNAESGDIIVIQGTSLGMTTVTIDVGADPTQMNFLPGRFNDNFFIN